MDAAEDIEDAVVVDELFAALFVDLIEFDADEGGDGGDLGEAAVVVLVGVPFLLGPVGPLAADEVAGFEDEGEVGMVDGLVEAQHVVPGGGEAAVVLQGDDHAEVGADFGAAAEGVDAAG